MNPHPLSASRPFPPYHHYYGSPLLDELHNFFPAILYEPTLFPTVPSLLAYVQLKMRQRFDLFSSAQHVYQQTAEYNRVPPAAPAARFPPAGPQPVTRQPPRPRQTDEVRVTMETAEGDGIHLLNALLGMNRGDGGLERVLTARRGAAAGAGAGAAGGAGAGAAELLNLFNILTPTLLMPQPTAAAMEPVIVRPTAQQIDTGTTLEILDADEEDCAICQDIMLAEDEVRTITACDHRFHKNCIDTWFQRNVRCPVCRHDVREVAVSEEEISTD
jgi:hypothetical protein